ncbi:MAG: ADOP family duplicated permease [Gemmatimonadales bacterium]
MIRRLFNFPRRSARRIADDVDDELRFHLDMRREDLVARGLTPADAEARARHEFGDLEDARRYLNTVDRGTEASRRRRDYMGDLKDDVIYALRQLRRAPAFTLAAVLTLALGIGATTTIFSVVNGVLLRPLPFHQPEELVRVWSANPETGNLHAPVSAVDLEDWRAQRKVIADLGGYWYSEGGSGIDLTGAGDPLRLSVAFVTPGFFPTLGVQPERGRLPREGEMVRGGPDNVVVLAHGFWQRQFGASASVVGTTLTLGGRPYEVLGVMPPSFRFPSDRVDAYIPFSSIPDESIPRIRPVRILDVFARVPAGATLDQARSEMMTVTGRLAAEYPADASWGAATLAPLQEVMTGRVRTALIVLLAAGTFVLLVGCVNVASLLLARAAAREREVAVRVSLGATRGRIMRQLFTESLVLAGIGGAIGLGLAVAGTRLLVSLAAQQLPGISEIRIDGAVLGFALGGSLLTGIVFGLVPALRASRPDLQATLREGGRGGGGQRLRGGLVIAEVALAVMLVIGAGLMVRSFVALLKVDPGFQPDHLVAVNFTLSTSRHPRPEYIRVYQDMIQRVRAVPGVVAAGAIKDAPFRGNGERGEFRPEGMVLGEDEQAPTANVLHVSDGYFHTIGAPILAGREFTPDDRVDAPFVVVINQTLAREYFPGGAVGRPIRWGGLPATVIGVVGDIRQSELDEPAGPTIYVDNLQNSRIKTTLVARTRGEPLGMVRPIQEAIWSVDAEQPITSVFTFDEIMHDAVAQPRLLMVLLGFFGAIGLMLGGIGIYGVLAYLVNQRQREIGVRLALGAAGGDVQRMVVGRGVTLAAIGVGLGLVGAVFLTRLTRSVLYGIQPNDPVSFAAAAVILLAAAVLASYLPARRAARVDPVEALRAE